MQKKDLSIAIVLTFLFGSLGILYTSFTGFLTFLIINITAGIFIFFIKLSYGSLDLPITFSILIFAVIIKFLAVYWTYNVVKEKNRRIENNLLPMSNAEENQCGFKNIGTAISDFIACTFFTCIIFAILSLTKIIDKSSDLFQGLLFLGVLILFLLLTIYNPTRQPNS